MAGRFLLVALVVAAALGLVTQLQGQGRAPETEIVFLYHSSTKGEIEECG